MRNRLFGYSLSLFVLFVLLACSTDARNPNQRNDSDKPTGPTDIVETTINPDVSDLPALPRFVLTANGIEIGGSEGSYCWPSHMDGSSVVAVCADKIPWIDIVDSISVRPGDTVTLSVESEQRHTELQIALFSVSDLQRPVSTFEFGTARALFTVDLPTGEYYARAFGRWPAGDASAEFSISIVDEVTQSGTPTSEPYVVENSTLLSIEDIRMVSSEPQLTEVTRDFLAAASSRDSSDVDDIAGWLTVQFSNIDGNKHVLYSEIQFKSREAANEWLTRVETDLEGAGESATLGTRGVQIDALKEGAAAMVAFVSGEQGYMLMSTIQPGDEPLVNFRSLQHLASIVEERSNSK